MNRRNALIRWVDVVHVEVTRDQEWGPSVSILEVRSSESTDEMHMQSGDVLVVSARERQIEYL